MIWWNGKKDDEGVNESGVGKENVCIEWKKKEEVRNPNYSLSRGNKCIGK